MVRALRSCASWCQGLTRLSQALLCTYAVIAVILCSLSAYNVVVLPVLLLPLVLIAVLVYRKRLRLSVEGEGDAVLLDDLFIRLFSSSFFFGTLGALVAEAVVGLLLAVICFGPKLAALAAALAEAESEATGGESDGGDGGDGGGGEQPGPATFDLPRDFAYYAYLFLTAFITAATVEEVVKLIVVRGCGCTCGSGNRACCGQQLDARPRQQLHNTVSLFIAASLGFAAAENVLYIFSTLALEEATGVSGSGEALAGRVLVAFARGIISLPVHTLCAAYTALRVSIRDVQKRHRDAAALQRYVTAGTQQFAILPSGVAIPLAPLPDTAASAAAADLAASLTAPDAGAGAVRIPVLAVASASAPQLGFSPYTGTIGDIRAASAAQNSNSNTPPAVPVWGWARVLWPAVLIHGTFDWQALTLADVLSGGAEGSAGGAAAALLLPLLCGTAILLIALWCLISQYTATFHLLAAGQVPSKVTSAPMWWPHWAARFRSGGGGSSNSSRNVGAAAIAVSGSGGLHSPTASHHALIGASREDHTAAAAAAAEGEEEGEAEADSRASLLPSYSTGSRRQQDRESLPLVGQP